MLMFMSSTIGQTLTIGVAPQVGLISEYRREYLLHYKGTGKSMPVACELSGTATTDDGKEIGIDEVIEFMDFFEVRGLKNLVIFNLGITLLQVQPAKEDFYPIADMVCRGREMVDMLPEIPDYYEYGSELIFHWSHKHGEDTHMHKLISPRNNW